MKEIKISEIQDKKIRNELLWLESMLSPENLYCDGEISHSMAMARYNTFMESWHELEKQIGYTVIC